MIIGGGLGVRLGEPYVERIASAMQQHLFVDERPPATHSPRSATSAARSARFGLTRHARTREQKSAA